MRALSYNFIQMQQASIKEFNKRLTNEILAAADQSIPTITNNKKNANLPPSILNMIKIEKKSELKFIKQIKHQIANYAHC